jgi:hypothetical protein
MRKMGTEMVMNKSRRGLRSPAGLILLLLFIIMIITPCAVIVMADDIAAGETEIGDGSDEEAEEPEAEEEEPEPPRPFPDWFNELADIPLWVLMIDSFPDWFYELPEEPFWFRELTRLPAWFYTLTEIPAWFYPEPEPEPTTPEPTTQPPTQPTTQPPTQPPTERPVPETTTEPSPVLPIRPPEYELDPGIFDPDDYNIYGPEVWEGFTDVPMPYTFAHPGGTLYSSVPDGMITSGEVRFRGDFESLLVTRDGELFDEWRGGIIFSHGFYTIYSELGAGSEEEIYSFRIITRPVGDIEEYSVPEGFFLQSVGYESENLVLDNERFFLLTDVPDGTYVFTISDSLDPDASAAVFVTEIMLMKTPPVINFEGLGENMTAEGEVTYWAQDPATDIVVYHNGAEIRSTGRLTQPGQYSLTATDAAGNVAVYNIRIFYVMNVPAVGVIIMGAVLITALTGYIVWCRVKVRVR